MRWSNFSLGVCVFLFFIFTISSVTSIGVTPSYYKLDFEPGMKKGFKFLFFDSAGEGIDVKKGGALAEYAEISTEKIEGDKGQVLVLLELPDSLPNPGPNRLTISGIDIIDETKPGVKIKGEVAGYVQVFVPYPGKYAEVKFSADSANQGEPILFKVRINSKGDEAITTSPVVDIFDSSGNNVDSINFDEATIPSSSTKDIEYEWDTKDVGPGLYRAELTVPYDGKRVLKNTTFRVGELFVGVKNYTREFERDKINEFRVQVESYWNDPIENVYANITIEDYNISFITPSIKLGGFDSRWLGGYFDTTSIEEDEFSASIALHYGGEVNKEVVDDLYFKKGANYLVIGAVLAIILLILLSIVGAWLYWRRKK